MKTNEMKIAIFGAGEMGIRTLFQVGKNKVSCFIDNNKTGKLLDLPIYSVDEFKRIYTENMVVLVTSSNYRDEIVAQLEENDINNYICFTPDKEVNLKKDYSSRLSADQWGGIYNVYRSENITKRIKENEYSVWAQELLKITHIGDSVLEIGCGSGETSVILSLNGRKVSAIDNSEGSLELSRKVASNFDCDINFAMADATNDLPFTYEKFDYIFQAGLLEHFYKDERISLLKNWKRYGKTMISLIPNSHSLAYHYGKALQEKNGEWSYGLEMPQSSLYEEFERAGLKNIREYTIGAEIALNFLPENHYLRVALERAYNEIPESRNYGQGYLLVTIGSC